MFKFFNSNVLINIGEAIGNIGSAVFKKPKRNAEIVDQAFKKMLASGSLPPLRLGENDDRVEADNVIDATFRVLGEEDK